jgi:hypothetical protein
MERKLCCRKCLLLGTCPGQVLVDLQNRKQELFKKNLKWFRTAIFKGEPYLGKNNAFCFCPKE